MKKLYTLALSGIALVTMLTPSAFAMDLEIEDSDADIDIEIEAPIDLSDFRPEWDGERPEKVDPKKAHHFCKNNADDDRCDTREDREGLPLGPDHMRHYCKDNPDTDRCELWEENADDRHGFCQEHPANKNCGMPEKGLVKGIILSGDVDQALENLYEALEHYEDMLEEDGPTAAHKVRAHTILRIINYLESGKDIIEDDTESDVEIVEVTE
jgi:hypothetical protein